MIGWRLSWGKVRLLRRRGMPAASGYRIIYITFTLEPARQALHVLPNPFHEEGRGLYRVVGSGLRYRFSLGPE